VTVQRSDMHGLCKQVHNQGPGGPIGCRRTSRVHTAPRVAHPNICYIHTHRTAAAATEAAGAAVAAATTGSPPPTAAPAKPPAATLLDPEVKARHRRPQGWVAPGPRPAGDQGNPALAAGPEETLSFLTGQLLHLHPHGTNSCPIEAGRSCAVGQGHVGAAVLYTAELLNDGIIQLFMGCLKHAPGPHSALTAGFWCAGDWRIFQLRNGHRSGCLASHKPATSAALT
jgi:hypothetical protein